MGNKEGNDIQNESEINEKMKKELLAFLQGEIVKCEGVISEYKNKEQTQRMPKLIFLANAIDCLFPYVKKIEEEKEIKNVKYISELMHNLFAFLWNDDKDLFYYNIEILNNIFNKKEDYLTKL